MEFLEELLRPFVSELGEIREELGAERVRRQIAQERAAALEAELEALREPQESPQSAEEEGAQEEEEEEEGPQAAIGEAQEGVQRSWWRRMFGSH